MTEESKENNLPKKIGVVGHVDHGKTTLTAALQAATSIPDREREIIIVDSVSEEDKKIEEIRKKFPNAQILTPEEALVLMKGSKEVGQKLRTMREFALRDGTPFELTHLPNPGGIYSDGKANRRAKRKNKSKGSDIYNLLRKKQ